MVKSEYRSKQVYVSDDSALKLLLPSLFGMAICIICLLGTTWAWFTASVSITTATIQAAEYDVDVVIIDNELSTSDKVVVSEADGVYKLSTKTSGAGYTVSITAKGTASTGYCLINDEMATVQLKPGESIQFTLYPWEDGQKFTFVACWGTYAGVASIENDIIVGSPVMRTEDIAESQVVDETENVQAPIEETLDQEDVRDEESDDVLLSDVEMQQSD